MSLFNALFGTPTKPKPKPKWDYVPISGLDMPKITLLLDAYRAEKYDAHARFALFNTLNEIAEKAGVLNVTKRQSSLNTKNSTEFVYIVKEEYNYDDA